MNDSEIIELYFQRDEQAIKEANTGSHVFLKGTISILDAIEDVDIFINKD